MDLPELCDQYDSALSSSLDKNAPLRKRGITIRPLAPQYSEEIKEEKVTCRRLERRWCRSRLTSDYQSYTDQRTVVKNTIIVFKSKMDYYSSLIYSAESDSKTLADILRFHEMQFHFYADDIQFYISFSTNNDMELNNSITKIVHQQTKTKQRQDRASLLILKVKSTTICTPTSLWN